MKKQKNRTFDYKNSGTLKLFAQHYRGHMGLFLLDMVSATLISAVDLIFPYVSKLSMQSLLPEGLFATFFTVMLVMVVAYILRSGLYFIVTYWGHRMGTFIEADMRSEVFEHIETLSFSYFNKNRTGQLMSRVTNDLFEIAELAHHGPEDLWISFLTVMGAFGILCTIEWRLALVVFSIIPLFTVFTVIQRRRMAKASLTVKAKQAEINSAIESGFSGIRTAKAFANEKTELKKFDEANKIFVGSKKEYYKSMAVFHSGMEFAMCILSVLVIMIGGLFIMGGSMDYVDLVTFSLYISTFITPIRKLTAFVEQFMAGMAGFKRFLEIMRTDPEITDSPDAIELKNVKGDIEIKNLTFSYPGKREVLKNINLSIPHGTTFALVGPSGGGKTTLSNLIPRFYDIKEGAILIDGTNIKDVTQESLRKAIGIVEQDVFMFAGTVYENIAYGKEDATRDEVVAAAVRAEIHDEIMKMPDGYDTYIGERGVMLSGGQKQRIGIARVFLKNPPVLILDEATSALDSVTEIHIQKAFDELAKGRTSVIIAHRLSTIRNADCIAVIDNNRLEEIGTHSELMEKGGEYSRLVKAQTIL